MIRILSECGWEGLRRGGFSKAGSSHKTHHCSVVAAAAAAVRALWGQLPPLGGHSSEVTILAWTSKARSKWQMPGAMCMSHCCCYCGCCCSSWRWQGLCAVRGLQRPLGPLGPCAGAVEPGYVVVAHTAVVEVGTLSGGLGA